MTYLPRNARSEFVRLLTPGVLRLMNCSDGGVFDSKRRFHDASAASNHPARSPMRGSGLGAVVDMLAAGDGAPPAGAAEKTRPPNRTMRPATRSRSTVTRAKRRARL